MPKKQVITERNLFVYDIDYGSMTDEKLITIRNTQKSSSEMHIKAEIELNRRERERQKYNSATQKSIKRMTTVILVFSAIALLLNFLQFCSN